MHPVFISYSAIIEEYGKIHYLFQANKLQTRFTNR